MKDETIRDSGLYEAIVKAESENSPPSEKLSKLLTTPSVLELNPYRYTLREMRYVLIVNDGWNGHWYHFDTKAELFKAWQSGGMSTMWEYVGNQLVELVA